MPGLVIVIARIVFQCLVSPVAEDALHTLLEVLGRHVTRCEEGTLVTVGHHDDGHVVIFATLIETILIVGNHITIDTRPKASKTYITVTKQHRVHLTHLLEVLFLQVFLKGKTLLLGTLL